jgi:prolyl 4-hydroxylase
MYGFNSEWKAWIWRNIADGVSKERIFSELIKEGYAYSAIVAELDYVPKQGGQGDGRVAHEMNEKSAACMVSRWRGDRLGNDQFSLYRVPAFVTERQCATLIAWIDAHASPSTVVDENPISGDRVSDTCHFCPTELHAVVDLQSKLYGLLGVSALLAEPLQGQRYAKDGFYRPHYDAFDKDKKSLYAQHTQNGGQRTWTCMVNLNTPQKGGGTVFPNLDLTVPAKQGQLLLWNNIHADGEINPLSLHGGEKVLSGKKYIITQWFRQKALV